MITRLEGRNQYYEKLKWKPMIMIGKDYPKTIKKFSLQLPP